MRRESLRTIGIILIFVVLAMIVVFFDDIRVLINGAMADQTDSLMSQLLR